MVKRKSVGERGRRVVRRRKEREGGGRGGKRHVVLPAETEDTCWCTYYSLPLCAHLLSLR